MQKEGVNMTVDLKPCPFCGGEAEHSDVTKGFWYGFARCKKQCTGFIKVEIWNTRHEPKEKL